jgi:tRNA(Ile)-lysidine synthase
LNPSVADAVFRTSQNLRVLSSLINNQTDTYFRKFIEPKDDIFKISDELFTSTENLFVDEVLKITLEKFLHSDVTSKDVGKLKRLYSSQKGKEIKFKENYYAFRERENLLLKREKKSISGELKIKIGQTLHLENFDISMYRVKNSRFIMNQKGCEFVSIDVENPTFTLRKWKDGDKFMPLGMKNFKNVSDFLTDKKIPASDKRKQLVLTYRNQIIWLVGLRIDERFKITSNTKQALKLCLS